MVVTMQQGIAVDGELNVYVVGARRIMQGQWDAQEPYVIKYNIRMETFSWGRVYPFTISSIAREIHIALDQDKNVLSNGNQCNLKTRIEILALLFG